MDYRIPRIVSRWLLTGLLTVMMAVPFLSAGRLFAFPNKNKFALFFAADSGVTGTIIDFKISPNGRFLYGLSSAPSFFIFDTAGFFVRSSIALSQTSKKLAIRPDLARAYILFSNNTIYSYDISDTLHIQEGKSLGVEKLASPPTNLIDMGISPVQIGTTYRLFVANSDSGGTKNGFYAIPAADDGVSDASFSSGGYGGPFTLNGLYGGISTSARIRSLLVSPAQQEPSGYKLFVLYSVAGETGKQTVGMLGVSFANTSTYVSTGVPSWLNEGDETLDFNRAAITSTGNAIYVVLDKAGGRSVLAAWSNMSLSGTEIKLGAAASRLQVGQGALGLGIFDVIRPITSTTSPYLYLLNYQAPSSGRDEAYQASSFAIFSSDQLQASQTGAVPIGFDKYDVMTMASTDDVMMVSAPQNKEDGYLYVAQKDQINVITDNPDVTLPGYDVGDVPSLTSKDTLNVTIQSDTAGTYECRFFGINEVQLGSGLDLTQGASVCGSPGVINKDEQKLVSIPIATLNLEGSEDYHRVYLFVSESGGGTGRNSVLFKFDEPPQTPEKFSLGFGDGAIYVKFHPLYASDLEKYVIYYKTQFPAGADFDVDVADPSISSVELSVASYGTGNIRYKIDGVTNGTKVCVRIVVFDKSGKTSSPTQVLCDMAEKTVGLIEKSGEKGGWGCSVVGLGSRDRGVSGVLFYWVCVILLSAPVLRLGFGRRRFREKH